MSRPTQLPSSQTWNSYPKNLKWVYKSKRALAVYHDCMAREENDIFVSDGKPRFVVLWDQPENENDFQPEKKIESSHELHQAIGDCSAPGPSCRFIFLHTESSRGKLCCTRDQLNQILNHHEVMPAFLDFCFEFKNKEKPTTTAMFRFEDHLAAHQPSNSPRIQHAFNIIAPEEDTRHSNYHWLIRHTTIYHSFDLAQTKSAWIIIKGNRMIRDRITGESLDLNGADTKQKQSIAQLAFALSSHIQILEWCTEGWSGYIDSLEEKVRKHATSIKLAPVEALSRKPPRKSARSGPRAKITGFSNYSFNGPQPIGIGGRIRSNLSRMASGFSGHTRTATTDNLPVDTLGEKIADADDENLDEIFTFDDLQRIRQVTDDAEQAAMIINENRRIITYIQDRYKDLLRSWNNFGGRCPIDRDSFEMLILNFCQQLSVFLGDLDSHEARVQLLLASLVRNEEMFQGILQYGNMRVGEYYAQSAETSANTMQMWTERMHDIAAETEHETVSMHGITVLTLIFLPGTFVSTLFSSGIWNFDGSHSQNIGDWETRVPALKLFFAISIPLMVVALTFWWITYQWAKGKHRRPSDWIPEAFRGSTSAPAKVGSGAVAGAGAGAGVGTTALSTG